jgi:tetratricopeptide (TPR) repeat protein
VLYPNVSNIELLTLTGRYREAEKSIEEADIWLNNIDIRQNTFLSSRLSRILGWIALTQDQYAVAQENLEASIEFFEYDPESIAWSQPYLALIYYKLGDREKAKKLIIESLSTTIDMLSYIPMVFTLPITLLLLVEEDLEFAKQVYTQVRSDRFMSIAKLFHDLVYKHLPEELTKIHVETVEHSDKHREALWETTRLVHAYLTNN